MADLNVRDIVRLKGHKTEMTIKSINGNEIECEWQSTEGAPHSRVYLAHQLEKKVEPKPPKKEPNPGPGGDDAGWLSVDPPDDEI